jgi:hypothetical protein
MAAPVGATTRCAQRIPPDACAPDKFSNLSYDAAAPPPVQANGPASAGWWKRPNANRHSLSTHNSRRARSLKGNSSIAPGCRASGYPGFPP